MVDPRGRIGNYIIPVAVHVELRIRNLPFKERNSNKYLICGSFPNNCRSTAILSSFANIMITMRGQTRANANVCCKLLCIKHINTINIIYYHNCGFYSSTQGSQLENKNNSNNNNIIIKWFPPPHMIYESFWTYDATSKSSLISFAVFRKPLVS